MRRDRALKVVLVLLGLLFVAAVYPMVGGVLHPDQSDTGDTMMASIYATLGVFLLLAVRNPSAHRSLIAFAAWSSLAHAVVMSLLVSHPDCHRTHGLSHWVGRAGYHRRNPDRAGSGKAVRRAVSSSRCVGSHARKRRAPSRPLDASPGRVPKMAVIAANLRKTWSVPEESPPTRSSSR